MSDDDERASERVGTVLNDKWTLERLIGIGGMAAVYAGLHRNGARAAIKVLHPAYARRSDVKRRFLREGYAANRVHHSGVVKVLDDDEIDAGPDEGGAFLVMELLEGQSLEDRLERGPPMTERDLLPILRAVLDVLEVAHKAGVIHRDLKPENLFLARDPENASAPPRIKILDFGLARVAEGGGRTMAGIAIGTPSYMPPEQAAGRIQEIDARADLFALGASCFRILAGRTVHPADGALAICALMAREPAPKLRSVAPDVSEKTAAVIDRALEFKRNDRWPNAGAMRQAVDEAIAALGGEVMQVESGMMEVEDEPPVKKRGGRSWVVWLGLLVVGGVGVKLVVDRNLISIPTLGIGEEAAITPVTPEASTPVTTAGTGTGTGTVTVTATATVAEPDAEPESPKIDGGAAESEANEPELDAGHLAHSEASGDSGTSATHNTRHDGGTHHHTHHGTRHHK